MDKILKYSFFYSYNDVSSSNKKYNLYDKLTMASILLGLVSIIPTIYIGEFLFSYIDVLNDKNVMILLIIFVAFILLMLSIASFLVLFALFALIFTFIFEYIAHIFNKITLYRNIKRNKEGFITEYVVAIGDILEYYGYTLNLEQLKGDTNIKVRYNDVVNLLFEVINDTNLKKLDGIFSNLNKSYKQDKMNEDSYKDLCKDIELKKNKITSSIIYDWVIGLFDSYGTLYNRNNYEFDRELFDNIYSKKSSISDTLHSMVWDYTETAEDKENKEKRLKEIKQSISDIKIQKESEQKKYIEDMKKNIDNIN